MEITISGDIEERTIAPMLLIPFVENAFKHGSKSQGSPGIWITLAIEPERMNFEVVNYVRKNSTLVKDPASGIGLTNVLRRLNLLYPGKYQLENTSDEEKYRVTLTLMI